MYMYDCVEHVACASLVDVHGVEHIKHKSMFV